MTKYGAKKVEVDNIRFDSKAEALYYQQLKLRKRAGEVMDFYLQPEFIILDGYTYKGKKVRPIKYRADFKVYHANGVVEVVDVKGFKTKDYGLKRKMFLARYGSEYEFTEVQA